MWNNYPRKLKEIFVFLQSKDLLQTSNSNNSSCFMLGNSPKRLSVLSHSENWGRQEIWRQTWQLLKIRCFLDFSSNMGFHCQSTCNVCECTYLKNLPPRWIGCQWLCWYCFVRFWSYYRNSRGSTEVQL